MSPGRTSPRRPATDPAPDPRPADPRLADPAAMAVVLMNGAVEVVGRLVQASNATLLVEVSLDGLATRAVYKPVRGERPLWDFPHGTLADREVATYLLCDAAGWDTVPLTVPRPDGPFGPGSVQLWVEETDGEPLVDVVEPTALGEGWLTVLEAESAAGDPLLLVHRDDPRLRRMALLDAVANNADRKGGHVLRGPVGQVRGVDHGLTFNTDDKLRTVLWGWAGEPLQAGERAELAHLADALADGAPLSDMLERLLRLDELDRTRERVAELLDAGVMPEPSGGWPSIPWPAI
ncbi:SCO1664 family protein [Jannaschia sp. R86511]|uniref:SCO1664 family protein n=1 Tax=Jannaschia sp. R86511 TaxID=3093853 RepID=UPI0036D38B2B